VTRGKPFQVLLLLILIFTLPAHTYGWSGKVIEVIGGDHITVLRDQTPVKIYLYGIVCPEMEQPFGTKAKQFTADMVLGKTVTVERMGRDRDGQTVAIVAIERQLLNEELVRAGYAWVWFQHCHEMICHIWHDLLVKAKIDRRGLWAEPKPIPPWQFRRAKRRKK
jgi:endonuclease YncB( thermonuclease family)